MMAHFLARPGFLLARIDQICTSLYGELSEGETLAQAEFLLLAARLGPAPQVRLARGAGVDTSTTAFILTNLCARSWVARGADEADRRRAVVALTEAGAARVPRIEADYAEHQRQLTEPLDTKAAARLKAILGRIATDPGAESGALDAAPSFLCRRALQLFQAQFVASMGARNLTPRQFSLLYILSILPALTQVGFARLFGLDPSTCGVVMRNLVKRGLIAGAPAKEDRRARVYRLTPAGRAATADAAPVAEQSERLVFRDIPAADVRWLVRRLQMLVLAHSHRLRFPGALDFAPGLDTTTSYK